MSPLPNLPHVPLEVAENIIDQLRRDVRSLRNCALTCRAWHTRARYHCLITSLCVQTRNDLYSIIDYFSSTPGMGDLVQSLSISPTSAERNRSGLALLEAVPVPLLSRFPNLRRYRMRQSYPSLDKLREMSLSLHDTTFIRLKTYLHVEELMLGPLVFRKGAEFARLLMALPRLQRLECMDLRIIDSTSLAADPSSTARYRNKCRLSTVTMRGHVDGLFAVRLLTEMSVSTLELLRCTLNFFWSSTGDDQRGVEEGFAVNLSELERLHFLEFMTDHTIGSEWHTVIRETLGTVTPKSLQSLTITFTSIEFPYLLKLGQNSELEGHLLDNAILSLEIPRITVVMEGAKRNRLTYWSNEMRGLFSRLHEGNMLEIQCSSASSDGQGQFGHDAPVIAMIASPDSRYVATSAEDGTIIVWTGTAYPQNSLLEIESSLEAVLLAFSDTGDFLVVGANSRISIWRIADGVEIASFEGFATVFSCTWHRDRVGRLTLTAFGYIPEAQEGDMTLSITDAHVRPSGTVVHNTAEPVSFSPPRHLYLDGIRTFHKSDIIAQSSCDTFLVVAVRNHGGYIWRVTNSTLEYEVQLVTFGYTDPDTEPSPTCAMLASDDKLSVGFTDGTVRWWDIFSFPLATTEPRDILTLQTSIPLATTESNGVLTFYPHNYNPEVTHMVSSPLHSFLVVLWGKQDSTEATTSTALTEPILVRTNILTAHSSQADISWTSYTFLQGHTGTVCAACISPCERYIATASEDTTVRLWSASDGTPIWNFNDHDRAATQVVFSSDGKILASAYDDGRVLLRFVPMFVRDPLLC